jgi:alcohol dehydrogenase
VRLFFDVQVKRERVRSLRGSSDVKAVVIHEHGGLDQLTYQDWPEPSPRPGEVKVRVGAVGLNHLDIFVRRGMPGLPVRLPTMTGGDVAGEVVELGDAVSDVAVGQRVLVYPIIDGVGMLGENCAGGMCEYLCLPSQNVQAIPDSLSFADAACLPVAYGTALRMLITRGQLQRDETILILGASGGVGTGAVQIAKMLGAEVIAVASTEDKRARLKELGADHTLDSAGDLVGDVRDLTGRVDMVINYTGGDTWLPSLRCLRDGGRLLTCGATAGYEAAEDIRYIWSRELNILGSDGWSRDDQAMLIDHVGHGRITPIIDRVLPMSEAREAERLIEERIVFGKVIIEP